MADDLSTDIDMLRALPGSAPPSNAAPATDTRSRNPVDESIDAYRKEVAAAGDQEMRAAQNVVDETRAAGQQQVDLAREFAASSQPFTEQAPHEQIQDIMAGAPFLFALAAIGGKMSGAGGVAMLDSLNGMSDGIIKGDQQSLQNHYQNYQAQYDKWKANTDQQYRVYKEMSSAYAGVEDGNIRALTAALNITKDVTDRKLQADDPTKYWELKAKLEEMHAKTAEAYARMRQLSGLLDPDTLDMAVTAVAADPHAMSQFASWGQAGQVQRQQINQGLAKKLKAANMTPDDLVEMRALAASNRSSLTEQVKMYRNVTGFETVARNNGENLVRLAKKLDDPDIPIAAAASRFLKRAGGQADASVFASNMATFQYEAGRILNNPTMKGQLTVSAVNDIQKVVNGTLPVSQLEPVINRLFVEFDVRKAGIQENVRQAQAGTSVFGKPPEESKFDVGRSYPDSSGNTATFLGGDWHDPKNWRAD